jgi:hypothetical protein
MVRHGRRVLQRAAVLEVGRDPGGPETVVAEENTVGGEPTGPDRRPALGLDCYSVRRAGQVAEKP